MTTSDSRDSGVTASTAEPEVGRLVGLWLLCVVFPAVLSGWSYVHLIDQWTDQNKARVGRELQNSARRLRALVEDDERVQRFGRGILMPLCDMARR